MRPGTWFLLGGLGLALATGLDAWHAHGLRTRLEAGELGPEDYEAVASALRHLAWAAAGFLVLGLLRPPARPRLALAAGAVLLLGVLGFSGSLIAVHALGAPAAWSSVLAPRGGGLLILGWLLLGLAGARRRQD